jgi:hypothetical protein
MEGSERTQESAQGAERKIGGKAIIEVKATIELDDANMFDLNGKGITVASVTSN